jgi:diguanylate cyclase (GGDEF)-like protein
LIVVVPRRGFGLYGRSVSAVEADSRRVSQYVGLHGARGDPDAVRPCLLAAGALIMAYPLLSATHRMAAFLIVSLSTLPAAVIGLRRTSPGQRLPWWLLLSSLISLNTDNVTWYWYVFVEHLPTGDGTIAGAFAALGQIFMFSAAITVVARRGRNDIGGMIDSTIVSVAVGGVLWIALLFPHLRAARMDVISQATTCVAVFMLTGILGALVRLLSTAKWSIPALWLLSAALTCSLTGIISVALTLDAATQARPPWTDMIYMGGYAALTLFGLDRSAGELLRPGPPPKDNLTGTRLIFLGLALGAMPVAGGIRATLGHDVSGGLLAAIAALVTPLVMLRIWRVAAERSWAMGALRYQAHHDALTGLPNRRDFADRLAAALHSGRSLVVLFCDLDGFKAVNDRLGHPAGDELLVEVANRLRRCVRVGDVVSRFGGDEFVILCLDAQRADVTEVCRRMEYAFSQPVVLNGEPVVVGASIGTVVGEDVVDAEELIHRADAAMYAAKQQRPDRPGVHAVVG